MSYNSGVFIKVPEGAVPPNGVEGVAGMNDGSGHTFAATYTEGVQLVAPFGAPVPGTLQTTDNVNNVLTNYPTSKPPTFTSDGVNPGLFQTFAVPAGEDGSTPETIPASYSGQGQLNTEDFLSTIGVNIPQQGSPALANSSVQQTIQGVASTAVQINNFYVGSVGKTGGQFS
jgi:hypothetical protein